MDCEILFFQCLSRLNVADYGTEIATHSLPLQLSALYDHNNLWDVFHPSRVIFLILDLHLSILYWNLLKSTPFTFPFFLFVCYCIALVHVTTALSFTSPYRTSTECTHISALISLSAATHILERTSLGRKICPLLSSLLSAAFSIRLTQSIHRLAQSRGRWRESLHRLRSLHEKGLPNRGQLCVYVCVPGVVYVFV